MAKIQFNYDKLQFECDDAETCAYLNMVAYELMHGGYDTGYQHGYRDGYQDGYKDGSTDERNKHIRELYMKKSDIVTRGF